MNDNQSNTDTGPTQRPPWNKGKLIGAKPPLRPAHVWAIRTKLQFEGRLRDLALFNLAIDSKLRGCDLVALRVDDIAPNGYALDRATVRQKKTGRPVQFEITEKARQATDTYLKVAAGELGPYLFPGRGDAISRPVSTPGSSASGLQASASIPSSMGRTRFAERRPLYRRTGNLRAVQLLLGHTKIESTVRYLGIEIDDAIEIAEKVEI